MRGLSRGLTRGASKQGKAALGREIESPICSADLPPGGDERRGEEAFCRVSKAPLKLSADYGDDELEAEEDF